MNQNAQPMFRTLRLSVVCTLLIATCAFDQWVQFKSEVDNFLATFPSKPNQKSITVNTASGPREIIIYSSSYGQMAFSVSLTAFPEDEIKNVGPTAALDGARDGAVANLQGKLLSELIINLNGNPGRELKISAAGDRATVRARLYLVGYRLYQLNAVTPTDEAYSPVVGRFLNSFKLL